MLCQRITCSTRTQIAEVTLADGMVWKAGPVGAEPDKDLFRFLESRKIGDKVRLTVRRRDGDVEIDVKLQAKP